MMDDRCFSDYFPWQGWGAPKMYIVPRIDPLTMVHRDAFAVGSARVDPATRTIDGPAGSVRVEPRAMQVLLMLADAEGHVVSRETLLARCWNGQIVGDDALHRVIGVLRRAMRSAAGDAIAIETIPKAGYRLACDPAAATVEAGAGDSDAGERGGHNRGISRRMMAGSAIVGAIGLVAAWRFLPERQNPRVVHLLDEARQILRSGLPDEDQTGIGFINEAIAIEPDNARAWGLMALAQYQRVENAGPGIADKAVADCETAARRALALDPRESNARAALAILPPVFGDWGNAERRYDAVLADDPENIPVIVEKGLLLMSVGRCREALDYANRAIRLEPFSPLLHYHRAFRLAANDRVLEADREIDRASQLWPAHVGISYARFLIYALSQRPDAALRHLDSKGTDGPFPPPMADAWRKTLIALRDRDALMRQQAVAANLTQARAHSGAAVNAILALNLLGAIDAGFDVANGYLLRRGPLIGEIRTPGTPPANEQRWRKTMMLFVPATAPMRADPRFAGLAEDMGMAAYWRSRDIMPDYLRRQRSA